MLFSISMWNVAMPVRLITPLGGLRERWVQAVSVESPGSGVSLIPPSPALKQPESRKPRGLAVKCQGVEAARLGAESRDDRVREGTLSGLERAHSREDLRLIFDC